MDDPTADGTPDDGQTAHGSLPDHGWFYQLLHTRIPPHAALAETVEGAVVIKRPQLKGLINGVLRQFQRRQEELLDRIRAKRFAFPSSFLAGEAY